MKRSSALLLFGVLSLAPALAAEEPPIRQASVARIWLKSPAGEKPIDQINLSLGEASIASWESDPEVAKRQKDLRFPITWWEWQESTLTFTPQHSGTVELILTGLWQPHGQDGLNERQEIIWDHLEAEGTTISNASFEEGASLPEAWYNPWGQADGYPQPDQWPLAEVAALDGQKVAASWHNRPLAQQLSVTAGQQVRITFRAKAALPPGFVPPKRLGSDTAAHQAITSIKRGVNLGNAWEAPPVYSWGIRYDPSDVDRVADEGFDHIRVPIAWHYYLSEDGGAIQISPDLLKDLEPVLQRALDRGLKVLINWHHFYPLNEDPEKNRALFVKGWTGIAQHFQSWPSNLYFELLNEPHGQLTTEILNPIQTEALAAIRQSNPDRLIFISPGDWGKVEELGKLLLPDEDENLIVTIHNYEPFFFTHQTAEWTDLRDLKNVQFPGPPSKPLALPDSLAQNQGLVDFINNYNQSPTATNPSSLHKLERDLDLALRWSQHFGRPIHLGEFGAIETADLDSRLRYIKAVRLAAESRQIPWTLWDWKARFHYWDSQTNTPVLRPAIFD